MQLGCLRTCYLAELTARSLQKYETGITEKEILLVGIAGLLHDIGHGPFSHVWERFLKERNQNWKHEDMSCTIVDHLRENLESAFEQYAEDSPTDDVIKIIKDLINPKKPTDEGLSEHQKKNYFLYEIVNNKTSKIDVDKWDYFLRDCHHSGTKHSFIYQRLLNSARVIQDEETKLKHLCFRDKEAFNIYQMFHTRWELHRKVYQHQAVRRIEKMLIDAFNDNNTVVLRGNKIILSECEDLTKWVMLNDSIIGHFTNREKIENLESRQLYVGIADKSFKTIDIMNFVETELNANDVNLYIDEIKNYVETKLEEKLKEKNLKIDFYIDVLEFDFGSRTKNPINRVKFYKQESPNRIIEGENIPVVSHMLPKCFSESTICCVSKQRLEEERHQVLKELFIEVVSRIPERQ